MVRVLMIRPDRPQSRSPRPEPDTEVQILSLQSRAPFGNVNKDSWDEKRSTNFSLNRPMTKSRQYARNRSNDGQDCDEDTLHGRAFSAACACACACACVLCRQLPEFNVRLDLGDVYTTTAQLELLPWVQEAMGKFAGARGSEHGWVSQRDQL
ncbi:uncharacterized protein RAG0_11459 [Rhynchosporium agropyri]|uniref:Uncharacterized protein n=1 Tax=Rhynchosporium agropyri TaxID=914238 RepID=A0A1E1L438_9HELO|nr:uncharacterized protein RAG0_11459 [Rhynchosporium agropyri]